MLWKIFSLRNNVFTFHVRMPIESVKYFERLQHKLELLIAAEKESHVLELMMPLRMLRQILIFVSRLCSLWPEPEPD